jgi:hypothetical protein
MSSSLDIPIPSASAVSAAPAKRVTTSASQALADISKNLAGATEGDQDDPGQSDASRRSRIISRVGSGALDVQSVADRELAKNMIRPHSGALFASNGSAVAGNVGSIIPAAPAAPSPSLDFDFNAGSTSLAMAPAAPKPANTPSERRPASILPEEPHQFQMRMAGENTYTGTTVVGAGNLKIDATNLGADKNGGESKKFAEVSVAGGGGVAGSIAHMDATRGGRAIEPSSPETNAVDALLFPRSNVSAAESSPEDSGQQARFADEIPAEAIAANPAKLAPEKDAVGGKVKQLLNEADGFYNTGKYDLAQKRLEQVLNVDPSNISARRGEEKINSAKTEYAIEGYNNTRSMMAYQVEKAWDRPVRKFGREEVGILEKSDTRRTQKVQDKMAQIVIPKVEFKNATVREALDFLKAKSKELDTTESDPNRRGVNIVMKMDTPAAAESAAAATGAPKADGDPGEPKITLSLKDVPVGEALSYVTKLANMKYKLDPYAAFVTPISEATETLVTKEYKVPPEFISKEASGRGQARKFLEGSGVQFPPGAYANYFPSSNRLVVKNTEENLDLIDTLTETACTDSPSKQQLIEEVTQGETAVKDQPFSTFSLHVSDVSFRLAQAALAKGQMPDPESIRPEEFYNAFDYGDPATAAGEKVGCHIEQCAHPFLQQRNLVRVAMRVPASGRGKGQPLRLTLLMDTSGSMEREDRAASVRRAMEVLSSLLGPEDRVTLIGFARQPRLLLEEIPGDQGAKLVEAVTRTPSQGGTNIEEALKLAGEQALKHRAAGAQNRIVMLTDGAVNLGNAQPESLAKMVEKLRQKGVAFDACGVGAEGYNDEVLEALTRKGDGRYYFLNQPEDADAGFAQQLAGALRPAAQNVKVQVNFNPARVAHYRLIGFEQHRLKKEDFHNDKVTAAELAAEEAAVALYQVEVLPEGEGELGEVSVRFREAASTEMVERCWTLPFDAQAKAFDKATPSMQLAGMAAMLAEKIRGGAMGNLIDLDPLAPVVNVLRSRYASQANVQALVNMFGQLQRMK